MTKKHQTWLAEYQLFLESENTKIPESAAQKVLGAMKGLLDPSPWHVFFKLLGIHVITGFLSLGVCHQFGMNPFGTSSSLDMWIMSMWGHHTCMVICGVLFIALPIFVVGAFITIEEVNALKKTEILQAAALGGFSLGIFAVFGAELAILFAGLWLLGALIGGFLATETIWYLRRLKLQL